MKLMLSVILIIIFFGLALFHLYWASGGQLGLVKTLPADKHGVPILDPTTTDSMIVGIVFVLFGIFYLFSMNSFKSKFPIFIRNIGCWGIPMIFVLRALGDFKYIGFFKQIKSTEFANLDTIFYTPLCIIVAIIGFTLVTIKDAIALSF